MGIEVMTNLLSRALGVKTESANIEATAPGPAKTLLATLLVLGASVCVFAQASPTDKIILSDGQILSGTLGNPSFRFSTAYGEILIPNSACRSLERKDSKLEILTTANGETITGYLVDSPEIQLSGGPRVPVAKELIERLVFAARPHTSTATLDYFQMKNGDSFYGSVLERGFKFTTSYGVLDTSFASLLKLEDKNGQTLMSLSDGSTVMGYLSTPSFSVRTAYDFTLKIPRSSIRVVQMRR